jgi:hypothetical protein
MTPKEIVFSNLDSAKEGGQFEPGEYLDGATAEDIAHDLVLYAEDCEQFESKDLVQYVMEWLRDRNQSAGQ